MSPVNTRDEVEKASRKATEALYGTEIQDFKIRELFPLPEYGPQDAWDVQVTFLLSKLKHTVDLVIQMKDGHVTNSRLIDTMVPL